MKRIEVLSCVLALAMGGLVAVSATDRAAAAVQLGARAGYSHTTGEVLSRSGRLGGNGLWGLVGGVELLLPLELEIAYERYTKSLDSHAIPAGARASYLDNAYLLTGKVKLPVFGGISPFWLHAGGGAGLHHIDTSTDSADQIARQLLNRTRNQGEWHAVIGADLQIASILAYGEYRFQNITERHGARFNSIYAGLNLYLE